MSAASHSLSAERPRVRGRLSWVNSVSVAFFAIFVVGAAFYLWTAATSYPFVVNNGQIDAYNRLATALLDFHLWIAEAPAALVHLPNPYNPAQNAEFQAYYHDFALYRGHFYSTWGPAPVIVFLVPLHLLGLEASPSLTAAVFATAGLGFALAALHAMVRGIGNLDLWMCVVGALVLALSSAVPFLLRRPYVYEDAVAGGYCFAMAGIWLAISALVNGRSSTARLVLMSLAFGLAAGSRPTLGLLAIVLAPVYLTLRSKCSRRQLLVALVVPVGVCFLLLAAYNQARFGNPLEVGTRYQLAAFDPRTAHLAELSYVPPGVWFYALVPPRPTVLFPFIELAPALVSFPLGLPAHYTESETVGGILPMAPIVIFLAALPWIWRRRPALLGSLAPALLALAGAGLVILLFVSYEFFAATERYAVDFTTLFLLGALATWFALSNQLRGRRRQAVRLGGGLLAIWGCLAGLAVSFTGYYNLLATSHPATWATLEDIGSPLSSVIAKAAGRPILAKVSTPNVLSTHLTYTSLGETGSALWLSAAAQAELTIVSPDSRQAALVARVQPGPALRAGPLELRVSVPGGESSSLRLRTENGVVYIPVRLHDGINRLSLGLLVNRADRFHGPTQTALQEPLLTVSKLTLAARYCPALRAPCR